MTTLREELNSRGYGYSSQLTNHGHGVPALQPLPKTFTLTIRKNCVKALALF